jgi:ABC-type transport system substrate-binding protein
MPDKVLRVGMLTDVDRVDPRQPPEFISTSVLMQVFEPPFSLPCEGRPSQPLLFAGPLERQPDSGGRMVYAGTVREDVTFADGTPLAATHVAHSLNATGMLVGQAMAEARGDRVLFTLERPNARFHLTLTQGGCGVFLDRGGKLHGTGPLLLAERSPGLLRMVRNERHRSPVALDEVHIRTYPPDAQRRPTALLAAIEAGEVDLCYVLGREDVSKLTKVRKYILPGSSSCFLYFNTKSPALAVPEARRGLAAAIDRRAIAGISYSNAIAFAAQSPLPPILGSGRDGLSHDPARARELLDRLGSRRPRRLTMLRVWGPRPYLPDPVRVGEAIVEAFAAVGVEVEVQPTRDSADYFRQVGSGAAELVLSGWNADTPDPADFLEGVLSSRAIPRPGQLSAHGNLARHASEAMDEALARYRAEPEEARWQAVLDLLRQDVPLLPLQYGAAVLAHSWRVRGFTPSPFGWVPLGEVDLRD